MSEDCRMNLMSTLIPTHLSPDGPPLNAFFPENTNLGGARLTDRKIQNRKSTVASCEIALVECKSESTESIAAEVQIKAFVSGIRTELLEYTAPELFAAKK